MASQQKEQSAEENCELTPGQLKEIKDCFDLFDKDGNGRIDADEVGTVMQAFGQNPTPCEIRKAIEDCDINNTGTIELHEFTKLMQRRLADCMDPEEELIKSFKMFDRDNNGYICRNELRNVLTALGEDCLTEQEFEDMIAEADVNGDGKIDYEEFAKIMTLKC